LRKQFYAVSTLSACLQGLVVLPIAHAIAVPLARRAVLAVGGNLGAAALSVARRASGAELRSGERVAHGGSAPAPVPTASPQLVPPEAEPPTDDARAAEPVACGAGMVLVEGEYCPEVRHECKRWLEDSGRYAFYRCAEYASATCLSKAREHKRFCIDRDEYVLEGETLPASHQSWTDASRACGAQGKRVCLESEYNFACEGEEMRPYPYGFKRDAHACNADRVDIFRADGQLRDLRAPADENPACVSPFGVHNLSGNLEEWTTIDGSHASGAPRPAMKGAYWQPSRNHCRAAQTAHDRFYSGTETGFRCCSDAP
jgi:sulfatase modifying factor 1